MTDEGGNGLWKCVLILIYHRVNINELITYVPLFQSIATYRYTIKTKEAYIFVWWMNMETSKPKYFKELESLLLCHKYNT